MNLVQNEKNQIELNCEVNVENQTELQLECIITPLVLVHCVIV